MLSTGRAASSILPPFVPWGRVKNGTEPHRPRSSQFQAPPHHRSARHPTRADSDQRQPQRRHPTLALGRGYSTDPWQAWSAPVQAQRYSGRPRLRPRQIPQAFCTPPVLPPKSPGAENLMAVDLARHAGSLNAPTPGCTTSGACAFASSVWQPFTKPSLRSPVPSSAGDNCRRLKHHFVRRSKWRQRFRSLSLRLLCGSQSESLIDYPCQAR